MLVRPAAARGVSVAGAILWLLVVWVVGVGNSVAVRVRVLSIVRIVRERVRRVRPSVAVSVRTVGVGTPCVLLGVRETVTVGVAVGVATGVRVEAVGHLPSVRQTVPVGVCVRHIRSVRLLFSVGQTIAVPVGPTIGGVERVGSISRCSCC